MKSHGFKGVDVYGVDDVYIDYTIIGKSRGFKGVDVYDVNDVYADNINQRNRAVPSQMMCTV